MFTWHFIETPFRKKRWFPGKFSVFASSFVATAVIILAALSVLYTDGFLGRNSFKQSADELAGDPEWNHWGACVQSAELKDLCSIGKEGGKVSFIFWGDSHVQAL